MYFRTARLIATGLLAAASTLPAAAQITIEREALLYTGQAVPGRSGETFDRLNQFATNNHGQVVVLVDTTSGREFWSRTTPGGAFEQTFAFGGPSPNDPAAALTGISSQPFGFSDTGFIAPRFLDSNIDNSLIAINVNDKSATPYAIQGENPPGLTTPYFVLNQRPHIEDNGLVTYSVDFTDNSELDFTAMFALQTPGSTPTAIAQAGDTVGNLAGATIENLGLFSTSNGIAAYESSLAGIGITEDNDWALTISPSTASGVKTVIAQEGAQAPGLPAGSTFAGDFFVPVLFDSGAIGYYTNVNDPSNPGLTGKFNAYFRYDPATMETTLLATEGQPIGDPADGITLDQFSNNDFGGNFAVTGGFIDGPGVGDNSTAVFRVGETGIEIIALEGDNMPEGTTLRRFMLVNEAGQTAFTASIPGTLETPPIDLLYLSAPDDTLVEILRTGDSIEVGGELKTVTFIDVLGFATRGEYQALTDDGTLTYYAGFEDGTEALLSARIVPEPTSLAMLGLGGLMLAARRRR